MINNIVIKQVDASADHCSVWVLFELVLFEFFIQSLSNRVNSFLLGLAQCKMFFRKNKYAQVTSHGHCVKITDTLIIWPPTLIKK